MSGYPMFDEQGKFQGYRDALINEAVEVRSHRRATIMQESLFNSLDDIRVGVIYFGIQTRNFSTATIITEGLGANFRDP